MGNVKPRRTHTVNLRYWMGDKVSIRGIDYVGIVTAAYVESGRVSYLIDNGIMERYYPEEVLVGEYKTIYPAEKEE